MKKIFPPLLLLAALCSGLPAAEDCSKNLDACSGAAKKSSPFVAASLGESPPPAPAAPKAGRAIPRAAPVAPAPAVPAPEAAEAPVPAADPAAPADPDKQRLSSPLWLLPVGAVLAGLYFYLAAGRRKGRRR